VGLLGGVASGKSRVAALLAERGAKVIDADALAHGELERPTVRERAVALFGEGILRADGAIDRAALGRRVFGDPAALAALEAIVHPGVIAAIEREIEAAAPGPDGRRPVIALDVPLIVEAGIADRCDERIFVEASAETRERRAMARGWPPGEVARREAHQQPLEEKRRAATFTSDTDGDLVRTAAEVDRFWRGRVEPATR
jgi:dephospho-CoA kinase